MFPSLSHFRIAGFSRSECSIPVTQPHVPPCATAFRPMPHSFWQTGILRKLGGADPLICAGRPRPALLSKDQQLARYNGAGLGAGSGPGVRPTIYAAAPKGAKLCGIGL